MPCGAIAGDELRLESTAPSSRSVRPFTVASSTAGPVRVTPASMQARSTHWPSPVRRWWYSAASRAMAMMCAPAWSMYEYPQPAGSLAAQARRVGQPADRLGDRSPRLERPVRAGVAEAAVGHVDDVGTQLAEALVAEPEPLHAPRRRSSRSRRRRPAPARRASSLPRSVRRLRVMPSFSTLWLMKPDPPSGLRSPLTYGPSWRTMSHRPLVTGSSMRITSAPNAASTRVAPAPASWPDRSQIRT